MPLPIGYNEVHGYVDGLFRQYGDRGAAKVILEAEAPGDPLAAEALALWNSGVEWEHIASKREGVVLERQFRFATEADAQAFEAAVETIGIDPWVQREDRLVKFASDITRKQGENIYELLETFAGDDEPLEMPKMPIVKYSGLRQGLADPISYARKLLQEAGGDTNAAIQKAVDLFSGTDEGTPAEKTWLDVLAILRGEWTTSEASKQNWSTSSVNPREIRNADWTSLGEEDEKSSTPQILEQEPQPKVFGFPAHGEKGSDLLEQLSDNAHARWTAWYEANKEVLGTDEQDLYDEMATGKSEDWAEPDLRKYIENWANKDFNAIRDAGFEPEDAFRIISDEILDQWQGWYKYQRDNGNEGREKVWAEQAATPYADLSEEDKDKDRREAKKILKALKIDKAAKADKESESPSKAEFTKTGISETRTVWGFDKEADAKKFAEYVEKETDLDADAKGTTTALYPVPTGETLASVQAKAEELGGKLVDIAKARKAATAALGLTPETFGRALAALASPGSDMTRQALRACVEAAKEHPGGIAAAFLRQSVRVAMKRTADETADWLNEMEDEYGEDWRDLFDIQPTDYGYEEPAPEGEPEAVPEGEEPAAEEPEAEEAPPAELPKEERKTLEDFQEEYQGTYYGDMEGFIRYMGQNHLFMRIDYIDRFGNYTSRRVEPYEIRHPWFWGFNIDAESGTTKGKGIRMFFMGRIVEVGPSRGRFIPRWDIKL